MMMKSQKTHKFGSVALLGRPNVGKSSLMNAIIGVRAAIVTPKPQTTRQRILGIYTDAHCQIVFVDTPGIHKAKSRLNRSMVREAYAAAVEADVLIIMQDVTRPLDPAMRTIIRHFSSDPKPRVHLLNKVDLVKKSDLLPRIAETAALDQAALACIPVSATRGIQIQPVLGVLVEHLPPGEPRYDPDWYTDQSQRQLASEYVREQVFLAMEQEIPFQTAVEVESFTEASSKDRGMEIGAVIIVASERHKPMLIGKGGRKIKEIGTRARLALQRLFDCPVRLDLWVKVQPGWFDNPRYVSQ